MADRLAALAEVPRRLAAHLARTLPERPRTAVWVDALNDGRVGEVPPGPTLQAVADALRSVDSRATWAALPPQPRRLAAWALWTGEPQPIRLRGVLGCCRDEAIAARGAGRVRSLIGSYLLHCDAGRPGLPQLGEMIREALAGRPLLAKWRERDEHFALFDPDTGPQCVAGAILGAARPVDVLRAVGLDDPPLTGSGFIASVHRHVCSQLPSHLARARDAAALERLFPFLEHPAGLRFPEQRQHLASGLLQPWIGAATPAPALRDAITAFLLRHLKDPRLHSGNWHGVPAECVGLFIRWIARASLEEFFELISDRNDSLQWPYRRAFWTAVARKGVIEDAWVVLGAQGRRVARGKLGSAIGCGELSGGFANDQSVILLQIGTLVLAEVSHNGRLHAWRAGAPDAPALGRGSYDRADVDRDGIDFPRANEHGGLTHRRPAQGWWQDRAADLLRSYTGLRLGPEDWRL
jgi:hypothetical protein